MPASIPTPAEKTPLVFLLADTQFLVDSSSTVFVRRAVQVNESSALGEIGRLTMMFVPDYQKLQLHVLRVRRGNEVFDKRDSANIRFLQRETGLESGIYSGVVSASVLIDDVRVGDTLEYEYSVIGANPVFQGKFSDSASWIINIPVTTRRVVLNHPASRDIRYRFIGEKSPQIEPTRERTGESTRLVWTQNNLAMMRLESFYPRGYFPGAFLQFSEYRNWNEVAQWAQSIFTTAAITDSELKKEIGRIQALPRETQVAATLAFVQNEIRYFSVSLGESSHKPSAPQVVMKRRFGDCKDKSLLLVSMLRELGFTAQPVLISIDPGAPIRQALPAPTLFDHVIVKIDVDGKPYFLDSTRIGQTGRLARMGQVHEDAEILVVAADTGTLSTVKSENPAALASSEVSEKITLPEFHKPGNLLIRAVDNGIGAELTRVWLKLSRPEDLQRALVDEVSKRYPGATLVGNPDVQDDTEDNRITITSRYQVPNMATENRDVWVVRFVPINLVRIVSVPPSMQRSAPLAIPMFPYQGRYTLDVELPKQVSSMQDPASSRVRNKAFEFSMTERFRGNNAGYEMQLRTLAASIAPGELPSFSADVRKMFQTMGGSIIVPKRMLTDKQASAGATGVDEFANRLASRTEERIRVLSKTIDAGKLRGKDLASAHADRGVNYSHLGKTAEALKDMDQAIALDENNHEHYKERAGVYFKASDFQRSTADFTRALTLGSDGHSVYYRRGMNHFYTGKFDEAFADFEQSVTGSEGEDYLFASLWYVWTAKMLNKPIPEKMRAEIDAGQGGAWPRPALAMFTGKLSPEQVLKVVEAKTGDERVMTLCEAYFYIGQYYVTQKDTVKAREFFEKSRATRVIFYLEYEAAQLELNRLASAK